MAIRAYDEDYLPWAQRIMGDAVDFAVMTLGLEPDAFGRALAVAPAAKQLAAGNPKYVAGMNGCEFARELLMETQTPFNDKDDAMYLDKSPEYWAGWALAFFQWHTGYSFLEILCVKCLEDIIAMYPTYHEMDIMQFVDSMLDEMRGACPQTRLRAKREVSGFSQSELAMASGVSVRQIQLFEQRQRDINKTSSETLLKLSRALNCEMECLMEKDLLVLGTS